MSPEWSTAIASGITALSTWYLSRKTRVTGENIVAGTAAQSTVNAIKTVVDEHSEEFKRLKQQLFDVQMKLAAIGPKTVQPDPNYVPIEKKKP